MIALFLLPRLFWVHEPILAPTGAFYKSTYLGTYARTYLRLSP